MRFRELGRVHRLSLAPEHATSDPIEAAMPMTKVATSAWHEVHRVDDAQASRDAAAG